MLVHSAPLLHGVRYAQAIPHALSLHSCQRARSRVRNCKADVVARLVTPQDVNVAAPHSTRTSL